MAVEHVACLVLGVVIGAAAPWRAFRQAPWQAFRQAQGRPFDKLRAGRAAALTEKEIRELGLLDADGAVCKAVPHIVETVILEATESLAALKPQDGGAELSGMKAAGVIEGAMRIRSLWDEMLRASRAEKRRSEDRGRRTEG